MIKFLAKYHFMYNIYIYFYIIYIKKSNNLLHFKYITCFTPDNNVSKIQISFLINYITHFIHNISIESHVLVTIIEVEIMCSVFIHLFSIAER